MPSKNGLLLLFCLALSGCATVNFSANYYTPPGNYKSELKGEWDQLMNEFSLKHAYNLEVVPDARCSTRGIPEINGFFVKIPESFIKYVHQNYYDKRFVVFDCVVGHEVCHTEYNLHNQSTPQAHYQVDRQAIELLKDKKICSAQDYYNSLLVLRNYWFARKGLGGHTFNVGWNLAQVAALVYGGSASFKDWFATDLDKRLALIRKEYGARSNLCFKRCKEDTNRKTRKAL